MGYRELSRMHVQEVVRRWQASESQRAIARAMGLSRVTARRYIAEAERLGLTQTGPPPTEERLIQLVQVVRQGLAHDRARPSTDRLEPFKEHLAGWVDEGMQLSCILELLGTEVGVSYSSLRRYLSRSGLSRTRSARPCGWRRQAG